METLDKNFIKTQVALTVVSAITLILILIFPSSRTPYLFGVPAFAIATLILSGICFATNFVLKRQIITHVFGVLSIASLSYALMEVVYAFVPLKLNIKVAGASQYFFSQIDSYILDRSYQYIAIGFMFLGLWLALGKGFTEVLRFGDLSEETTVLGSKTPMTWKRALLRISFMLTGLTILAMAIRPSLQISSAHIFLFVALLIGGFNNSLIEEIVFRGLLQPAFTKKMSPESAIKLQAVIFSVVHWSYVGDGTWSPVLNESVRLILYIGIGLLFGRAARETKGIGVSTILHFLITSAIWAELTFTNPV